MQALFLAAALDRNTPTSSRRCLGTRRTWTHKPHLLQDVKSSAEHPQSTGIMSSEAVGRDAAHKPSPNAGERAAAAGGAVRIRQSAPNGRKPHLSSSLDCKASSALPLEVGSPHCAVPALDAERGRRGVGLDWLDSVRAVAFHPNTCLNRGKPNFPLLLAWRFPSLRLLQILTISL